MNDPSTSDDRYRALVADLDKHPALRRGLLLLGRAAFLGMLGLVGWFFFGDTILEHSQRRSFDAAVWQAGHNQIDGVRIRMVDDLLGGHDFHGMTRKQVISILGTPSQKMAFKGWDMAYWLGPERGWISIDSEWLVFRLDGQGNVSEYVILKD